MKEYYFKTDCIHSDSESINKMRDQAIKISYKTILRHCNNLKEIATNLNYDLRKNAKNSHGITLFNDWAVSFYKSKYRNEPCYYFLYSGVEFIWTK